VVALLAVLSAVALAETPVEAGSAEPCPDYAAQPGLLVELEPEATRGALSEADKACLEERYRAAADLTVKNKISRVELVNAYAYDTELWATLVRRHLDEVDRSDPDISYLYAFWLFNTDKKNAPEVVRWAAVGLDRAASAWQGDTFVARVYGLMRLRAQAANALWADAEDKKARGADPGNVDQLRNDVKTYAREWLDFAKSANRDQTESLELCLSAANTPSACGVEGGG
jgi:hypothetical protein